MRDVDPKAMITWLESSIRTNEVCIAYYQQFPEFDKTGRHTKLHMDDILMLKERIAWWQSQVK